MRRFDAPPHRSIRYAHRPGAYAIVMDGARLLLTRQLRPRDELQLPGGGIDADEHPIHALHREVFEETGCHIHSPRRLGAFRRFVYMPEYDIHAEKVCHIYLARPGLTIGPPSESDHRAIWWPLDRALPSLSNEGDVAFLNRILRRSGRIR